ncbi:Retrotransposon gag domain [Sesbania bispinosa]|nr:Retrotransposon gag domain [Sesbania bispinosa]
MAENTRMKEMAADIKRVSDSITLYDEQNKKASQIPTWTELARAVEEQFGPSQFDCPRAQLFKLSQDGSVADYYTHFVSLANRVDGLSDAALLDCFVSGLRDPIRRESSSP